MSLDNDACLAIIKQKFKDTLGLVDRAGVPIVEYNFGENVCERTLHLHLLHGLSEKKALDILKNDLKRSDFEADFALKKAKEFLKDMLDNDLESIRKVALGTEAMCSELAFDICAKINELYKVQTTAPIDYKGSPIECDEVSRRRIVGYVLSERSPIQWTCADNTTIECGLSDIKQINKAIVERELELHTRMRELKKKTRTLCEQRNYTELQAISDELHHL